MLAKKHFEINPNHPVMKELLGRIKETGGEPDKETTETADLLFEISLLNSGFVLDDATDLNTRVQKLIKADMGMEKDAPVEEIEIDLSELEEEELEEEIPDDYDEDYEDEIEVEEEDPEEDL